MILNNSLILPITLLIGVSVPTVVTAFLEDGSNGSHTGPIPNNSNEELTKQQMQDNEKSLEMFKNMHMDTKAEHTLKSIRNNISDNQFSNTSDNQFSKIDTEMDKNISLRNPELRIGIMSKNDYDDYESETSLNKNNRAGKLITMATTTIPQYIRSHVVEQSVLSQTDVDISLSDYVEDEIVEQNHKYTTKMPFLKNLDNSSEESGDIKPLAMKFYNEISPANSSSTSHVEAVSSEDYYEEEYREPISTTSSTSTTTTHALDDSIYHSTGSATSTRTSFSSLSTARTTPTPREQPLTTISIINIPMMEQIDPLLLTTLTPLLPSLLPATLPPQPQLQPRLQPQTQTQTMLDITTSRIAGGNSAVVPISDKKGKQIPIISTVPVITTTTTTTQSRRRLLPHEQLRNYIEDAYIRMPLAVIVDPSSESLEKTKTLWNDALRTNLNIKIVLVTLNESQEESPAAFNFNNTRQFITGLNSIKEQNSGDVFRGVSHAAELVPYDSAVFISTAQLAKHTDQVQDSAITLLKKRIRLYLIWFGERSLSENETQDSVGGILGEVAIRSGGEILHVVSSENSQELEGSTVSAMVI